MTSRQDRGIEAFLKGWAPELGRAVEMFRGEAASATWALLKSDRASTLLDAADSVFWWRQQFESGGTHSLWIGAPEETWLDLTAGLGTTPEDRRSLFLEMLGPSLEGAAHVLTAGSPNGITCKDALAEVSRPSGTLLWGALTITLNERALAPIFAALEPAFASWIASSGDDAPMESAAVSPAETGKDTKVLLERLMELELPISIVLGRAVLPIRDVLKLSAGSLVDLDRRVGDLVEVVVHNVVVARGEVVAVKGNYGVRVKEVISRRDRIALQASAGLEGAVAPAR
ncbi:MAG TPA: FliM/FliN family flagellar motor switch protein [Bryobacteraceae bacterium]|nr:FliM/FliN family flagellar motor switch protein [Bryobacteraceae bacterium]